MGRDKAEVSEAKEWLKKKQYASARACAKEALDRYPTLEKGFAWFIVSETLYYGNLSIWPVVTDWYSVLHLHPSSTETEVRMRVEELRQWIKTIKNSSGLSATVDEAFTKLDKAISLLCDQTKRLKYDQKRNSTGLVDEPPDHTENLSFRESYMSWKSPNGFSNSETESDTNIPISDDAHHAPPGTHKKQVIGAMPLDKHSGNLSNNCVPSGKEPDPSPETFKKQVIDAMPLDEHSGNPSNDSVPNAKEPNPSPENRKRKMFDATPQTPHYGPLGSCSGKLRESIIEAIETSFIKLLEDINNLKDAKSLWLNVEDYNQQLAQFEEMGYNVNIPREQLSQLLRVTAERSQVFAGKLKTEIEVNEVKVSQLEAELQESKLFIKNHKVTVTKLESEIKESKLLIEKHEVKITEIECAIKESKLLIEYGKHEIEDVMIKSTKALKNFESKAKLAFASK